MTRRSLPVLACLAVLVLPSVARAGSAMPIAEAPTIQYGTTEAGGGRIGCEYWRLPAYAGDRVTLRWQDIEGEYNPSVNLFGPAIEDATIHTAAPLATHTTEAGANLLTFTVSFTGLGVMQVMANTSCFEFDRIATYTFTATTVHAVTLTITAPILARPHGLVTVRATVASPAGTPEGACLIQGFAAPLTGGHCSRRVRLGSAGRQAVRVAFVPGDGWQGASDSRHIRLAR